ncbi:ABC transporter permease [Prosthecomicrobium hirschii]|uniref:ABC transporter permease n=1 Tax=Prosthecodimorpha hirschii TaxID=665126 RepID=A0A0P6W9S5_9HYPH|nr:ABC transporter permease [Prosthecomicrobium hirschii]KPL51151.1 ABC transporter permease [Prosthecomicrobium hirschii]MCW1838994.1 ABC transporter permease [Prosthecomicrobium hirschii]
MAAADAVRAGRLRRALDSDLFYSFRRSPLTVVAAVVVLVIGLAALLAPWIAPTDPFDPSSLDLMDGKTPPLKPNEFTGHTFLLGTDDQGRDVFSAILYGARISLLVGFASVVVSMAIGIALGLLAGYRGGWVDSVIMRVADVQLTFPDLLVALMIFGIARGALPIAAQEHMAIPVLILSIGIAKWPQYARTVRGVTMVERGKDYVQAARVVGLPAGKIMRRHILPNVLGPVLVIATLGLSLAIITEATLSFLGVGVPPTSPSLGTLLRIGQEYIASGEWWILFFPAIALVAIALSVNLLGDWLRDALNPRLR